MLTIQGKITSNSMENGKQLVTVSNEEETKIVVLQDTYLIDAETGFRMMPEEMLGREVRAYIKGGETAAILTISEQAVANYAEIEAIEKQADGNLLVTTPHPSWWYDNGHLCHTWSRFLLKKFLWVKLLLCRRHIVWRGEYLSRSERPTILIMR